MKKFMHGVGNLLCFIGLLCCTFIPVAALIFRLYSGSSLLQAILTAGVVFILGLVLLYIGGGFLAFGVNYDDIESKSSGSYSGSSSSSYSYSGSYSDSYSYDSKYHDELDAAQHAAWITETYGEDWKGYDPEAPGPDPDTFVDIDW